nr:hypothetical protein [Tanacetum cinerariifolium]
MRIRSSSNLPVESPPNPSTSNPKRRNRKRSKQPFILEESPVDTMVDQRTMAELLSAPTKGYAEAIVVPPILAEQFELKHSLINMMTSDQFFGLEKDNPHDHIRCDANSNSSSSEIAKLTHAVNQQTSAVTTAMTAILKQFQATPPPASVKVVEEIYVTCGGAHPYYQCLASGGNTFLELKDYIQGYVAAAAVNYNRDEDEPVEETLTDHDLAEYTIRSLSLKHYPICRLAILCLHPHAHDLESFLTISPSIYALLLDRFDNDVSFEEDVVYQRLQKTLTHVLELSSCINLDDRAWGS